MSKDTHSFSVSVACEVGVIGAILLQHVLFLQKSFAADGEDWRLKWVKRPAKSLAVTYPYLTPKQAWAAMDALEKEGFLISQISNAVRYDRSKSYALTGKGLLLMGENAFSNLENGISEMENPNSDLENLNKEYSSLDSSPFNRKENAGASDPPPPYPNVEDLNPETFRVRPPFEKIGEFSLEPDPSKKTAPGAGGAALRVTMHDPELPGVKVLDEIPTAPTVSPASTGRVPRKRSDTQEEIDFAADIISYLNQTAGREFRLNTNNNAKGIIARRREGFTADDMRRVVDFKTAEWKSDPKFFQYLCPDTLFCPKNFEKYLQAAKVNAPKQQGQKPKLRATLNYFGDGNYDPDKKQAF